MTASEEIAGMFAEIENDFGDTVQVTGTPGKLPCRFTLLRSGNDPMEGGEWPIYSGIIWCRLTLLKVIPEQGQTVVFKGQTLHIQLVSTQPDLPLVKMEVSNSPAPK